MSIRIHELARRWNMEGKDMLALLRERGYVSPDTRSISSTVARIYIEEIEKELSAKGLSTNSASSKTVLPVRESSAQITLEGEFSPDVLGSFSIIRGFATLQDLAAISAPYYMVDGSDGVAGHQRQHDEDHATEIKNYFELGDHAFIPEIILSLRLPTQREEHGGVQVGVSYQAPDGQISLRRTSSSDTSRTHRLRLPRPKAGETETGFHLRRIDGNHRLAKAAELQSDPQRPNRYRVPYCLIVLGPSDDEASDYTESLIFHSINTTARPLDSEHALNLILRQSPKLTMPAAREFAYNPVLHFTRLLQQHLKSLPSDTRAMLGERSLSRLAVAAREMLRSYPEKKASLQELRKFADELVGAVLAVANRLSADFPDFVAAECFPELVAHAWMKAGIATPAKRRAATERRLEQMARWLGGDGLRQLRSDQPLGRQLIQIHETILSRAPRRVFLARWYPRDTDGKHLTLANARLDQVKIALDRVAAETGQRLELTDLGSEAEPARLIHPLMFEAIKSADIILADLSGLRPNVFAEAGFALQHLHQGRLVFLFQSCADYPQVPFDLAPYNRVEVGDAGQIPQQLVPVLKSILDKAARREI